MKTIKQYFPVALFIMLYKMELAFEFVDEIQNCELKINEQFFLVMLFTMLYKMVLLFESVVEILRCDHSNESYYKQYFPVVLMFIML